MSITGPAPKPTALRLIEGNPSRRPFNENEPKPRQVVPSCPKHLTKEAKRQWKKISKTLFRIGVLTEIDGTALSMYCDAWARWVDANEKLQKFGPVFKSPKSGFPILSPYVAVASQAFEQMRRLLCEFGMTPSSRSRISASPQVYKKDEMEDIID